VEYYWLFSEDAENAKAGNERGSKWISATQANIDFAEALASITFHSPVLKQELMHQYKEYDLICLTSSSLSGAWTASTLSILSSSEIKSSRIVDTYPSREIFTEGEAIPKSLAASCDGTLTSLSRCLACAIKAHQKRQLSIFQFKPRGFEIQIPKPNCYGYGKISFGIMGMILN
jgi:hypothetical protein